MPKAYSEYEKEYIKKQLKEEAADCLGKYGIKGTTVDKLVKRVKIPKGTFYLFYQSKELLIFEVLLELHEQLDKELLHQISKIDTNNISLELMTDMIFNFYKMAHDSPMIKLLTSGEIEILERKLPAATISNHLEHDNFIIEKLLSVFPNSSGKDIEIFSSAFRNIFFSMIYSHEMGDANFDDGLKLLIKGLVIQLF